MARKIQPLYRDFDPDRIPILREVNTMLRDVGDMAKSKEAVRLLLASDVRLEAAVLRSMSKGKVLVVREVVLEGFRSLMLRRDFVGAATLLWPEHVFTGEPWSCGKIWHAMDEGHYVSVLGSGATGKSYNVAVRLFMEWAADPDSTRVDLVSKNDEKIKKLFADFVNLHRMACVTLPGAVEAETITTDKIGGWGIFRNLIRAGDESSSVLKGTHEKPRLKRHPVYGYRTARYVMIDEAQDVSPSVFDDIGNIMLSVQDDNGQNGHRLMRQIILTANPSMPNSRYGEQCRPEAGWASIDDDTEDWVSRVGARCVRIDALKTENVRQKKAIYPGMITWEGVQTQLAICDGNENHPVYWTYVRGMFPPEGALSTLIPQRWLAAAEGEWIFENRPTEHCGIDVARLGGDAPAMAFMRVGKAVAWKDYTGVEYRLGEPGWRVQLDTVITLPGGDTQELASDLMMRLRDTAVRPEHCAVDMTGSSGVYDLMVHQWDTKNLSKTHVARDDKAEWQNWVEPEAIHEVKGGAPVIGVNYSRKASNMRVSVEDSLPAKELYVNTASELWFALSKYFELGYIKMGRSVSLKVQEQMSTRKGGSAQGKGKKMQVESKEAHKKRLAGKSCDEADSITLALFSVRAGTPELLPKSRETQIKADGPMGPGLRDGEPFSMKDDGYLSPPTFESIVQENTGEPDRSRAGVPALQGAHPSEW